MNTAEPESVPPFATTMVPPMSVTPSSTIMPVGFEVLLLLTATLPFRMAPCFSTKMPFVVRFVPFRTPPASTVIVALLLSSMSQPTAPLASVRSRTGPL